MIIEEFYDAESSPDDDNYNDEKISNYSIESFEFDFMELRHKQDESFRRREKEIHNLKQNIQIDSNEILENHNEMLKFRERVDLDKNRNLSNSTQEDDLDKSFHTESETETKHKTWSLKQKQEVLDEFTNEEKLDEEFINPVDKQILYHIGNKRFRSDSDGSNEDVDSVRDESILNDHEMFEDLEGVDDDAESKSFTHKNYSSSRKSFDTTSMNISGLTSKEKQGKKKNRLRRVITKFGRAVKSKKYADNSSDSADSDNDQIPNINESSKTIKYKSAHSSQTSNEFDKTQIIQVLSPELNLTHSIIWSMKFSPCGKLLATAGKDKILRVWVLKSCVEQFVDLIKKNNNNELSTNVNVSAIQKNFVNATQEPFVSKPFLKYEGHSEDILDVSWSKNLFLLTASSDKTCRLWHIYKSDCLCTFNHQSIVSSISFHPKDDRYFISACLDCKLRLWNISDKVVVLCNDLNNVNKSASNFITAISFCQGGKLIAVGTFDGKCIFYHTEHLKYYSLINVRSTRGRNSKGSKITGIESLNNDENKILITSNDSRIRLYDLRDLSLVCKYKGFSNSTVHIRASLSPDDKFIISGSKNKCTYIWKTNHQFSMLTSGRRDRNNHWERIQAHNAIVTCALFAPKPSLIHQSDEKNVHVFVSAAGCDGVIKIFLNKSSNFI